MSAQKARKAILSVTRLSANKLSNEFEHKNKEDCTYEDFSFPSSYKSIFRSSFLCCFFGTYNLGHSRSWRLSTKAKIFLAAAVKIHGDLLTCVVGKIFEISLPVRLRKSRTPGA